MKNIRKHLKGLIMLFVIIAISTSASGQGGDFQGTNSKFNILDEFLKNNPLAIEVKILSEGTMAFICADENDLLVKLQIKNSTLFMRMLMQGLTLHIDPSGGKKKKYAVIFPSARDVQSQMGGLNDPRQDDRRRPDIGPLILHLNAVPSKFSIKGKSRALDITRSCIELDAENELLNFYVLIPKEEMMMEKKLSALWSLGVFLDSPEGMNEEERSGDRMMRPRTPEVREIGPFNGENMERLMTDKINTWVKFSINDANSVNLK